MDGRRKHSPTKLEILVRKKNIIKLIIPYYLE
jgi:hypothetical protein